MPRHGAAEEKVARLVVERPGAKAVHNLEAHDDPRAACRVVWRLATAMQDLGDVDWYVLPGRQEMQVMENEAR